MFIEYHELHVWCMPSYISSDEVGIDVDARSKQGLMAPARNIRRKKEPH